MNDQIMNRNLCKMDILFYNSYMKCRNSYILRTVYHVIKLLLVVIFLPIDIAVLQTDHGVIIGWLGVAIAVSAFNVLVSMLIVHFGYGDNQVNNGIILELAVAHEHNVISEPIEGPEGLRKLKNCVSAQMYNQPNETQITSEGLTKDLKKRYEAVYSKTIQQTIMSLSPCLSTLEGFSKFGSFGCLVFGIVALSISGPLPAEIGVGVAYLVMEVLTIWFVLLFFLALALCPLLTLFICIYCCCCRADPEGGQNYSLPEAVPATADMIKETDGSCNICLQNFQLKKNVIILPCSKKHMFHEGCIGNWVKFSMTCPLCRYKLNSSHPI